jgi:hypothetical protein
LAFFEEIKQLSTWNTAIMMNIVLRNMKEQQQERNNLETVFTKRSKNAKVCFYF